MKPLCFEASDEDEAAAYKSHLAGVVALSGKQISIIRSDDQMQPYNLTLTFTALLALSAERALLTVQAV